MKYQGSNTSVNVCIHCRRKHLTIKEVEAGRYYCVECTYFNNIGVFTIEQYNNWLKK